MRNRINLNPRDLSVVTAATDYPVSVSEVKDFLRITDAFDDAQIDGWIQAATAELEASVRRAFVNTTFDEMYDAWPIGYSVSACLQRAPLVSVTSISYVDTNGDTQTWSSSEYVVDTTSEPGRIELAYGETIPSIRAVNNAVTVRYVAGYGTAPSDVPEIAKQWIYLRCVAYQCRRPPLPEEQEALDRLADLLRYGL